MSVINLLFRPTSTAAALEESPGRYLWVALLAALSTAFPVILAGDYLAAVSVALRFLLESAILASLLFALLRISGGQGLYGETLGAYAASLAPAVLVGPFVWLRYVLPSVLSSFSAYPYDAALNVSNWLLTVVTFWQAGLLGREVSYLHGVGGVSYVWVAALAMISLGLHMAG